MKVNFRSTRVASSLSICYWQLVVLYLSSRLLVVEVLRPTYNAAIIDRLHSLVSVPNFSLVRIVSSDCDDLLGE